MRTVRLFCWILFFPFLAASQDSSSEGRVHLRLECDRARALTPLGDYHYPDLHYNSFSGSTNLLFEERRDQGLTRIVDIRHHVPLFGRELTPFSPQNSALLYSYERAQQCWGSIARGTLRCGDAINSRFYAGHRIARSGTGVAALFETFEKNSLGLFSTPLGTPTQLRTIRLMDFGRDGRPYSGDERNQVPVILDYVGDFVGEGRIEGFRSPTIEENVVSWMYRTQNGWEIRYCFTDHTWRESAGLAGFCFSNNMNQRFLVSEPRSRPMSSIVVTNWHSPPTWFWSEPLGGLRGRELSWLPGGTIRQVQENSLLSSQNPEDELVVLDAVGPYLLYTFESSLAGNQSSLWFHQFLGGGPSPLRLHEGVELSLDQGHSVPYGRIARSGSEPFVPFVGLISGSSYLEIADLDPLLRQSHYAGSGHLFQYSIARNDHRVRVPIGGLPGPIPGLQSEPPPSPTTPSTANGAVVFNLRVTEQNRFWGSWLMKTKCERRPY